MINLHPFRAADTESLSELRAGTRHAGARLLRGVVRASDAELLVKQARAAQDQLLDAVAAVARRDDGPAGQREKAAEFIIHVRSRGAAPKSVEQVIDRVAEAAARARFRSGRVVDFLATWLFVAGEEFIAQVSHAPTVVEMELAHPALWNRFRAKLLELLEAGAERLRQGRRFRLAESYLARFRLVRARSAERYRSEGTRLAAPLLPLLAAADDASPDYVVSMVVDLFVLSLQDVQQRLVVAQIPGAPSAERFGVTSEEHRRLWLPLRAARADQAFERFDKTCDELGLSRQKAVHELCSGMATHLRRTWEWFFPDRRPFGLVVHVLRELEAEKPGGEAADTTVARCFQRYAATLSFVVRLATEDSEHAMPDPDDDDEGGGGF